jgi:hypothetical protein
MATVIKPRTAIILALTVAAVAVSSLVLLPRWRATLNKGSSRQNPESASDRSINSLAVLQAATDHDNRGIWSPPAPRGHPQSNQLWKTREAVRGDQNNPNEMTFEFQPHDSGKETDAQNTSKLKSRLHRKSKVPNAVLEPKAAIASDHKAPVLTLISTTISPVYSRLTKESSTLKDLPSMNRGSVEIRPERLPPPTRASDIYISLLTAAKFHDDRVSLLYLTWLQTFNPKQVSWPLSATSQYKGTFSFKYLRSENLIRTPL